MMAFVFQIDDDSMDLQEASSDESSDLPKRSDPQTSLSTSHHDPNADRIKSLVGRFLKARPTKGAPTQTLPTLPRTSTQRKKKLDGCSPAIVSAGVSDPKSKAESSKAASTSSLPRSNVGEFSDIKSVLEKYNLPPDVSVAVLSAVAAKQLPNKPASLDSLLSRLLLPESGLKRDVVHAGKAGDAALW